MPIYPPSVLDEIRAASDLVSIISQHVALKRVGKNFVGLCPFHKEKSPSFNVNPHKQFYKCYGCGEGGDVISFVRKVGGLGFQEAVRQLAHQFHVALPETDPQAERLAGEREVLYRVNAWAVGFFEAELRRPGNPGMPYLVSRGLTPESIAAFRLGYAPESWDACVAAGQAAGFDAELLERAGLALPGKDGRGAYDRFRARVIFPIFDPQGRTLGFGGRVLAKDQEPKYLNSPTTPVFNKGAALYGLDRAANAVRQEGRVAVMEGYTDVIRAHQAGLTWAAATLGTALTGDHARLLKRYTDQVVLVYDADAAGKKAADRGLDVFLQANFLVRVCTLPEGEDPCDYFAHADAAAFAALAASAEELVDYRLSQARRSGRFATVKGQTDVLAEILQTAAGIPDAAQRELVVKRVSEKTGVTEEALWKQMQTKVQARPAPVLKVPETVRLPEAPAGLPVIERGLLGVLLYDPKIVLQEAATEAEAARVGSLVLENARLSEAFRRAFVRGIASSAEQGEGWDPQRWISTLAAEDEEDAKRLVLEAWDGAETAVDHRKVWRDCLARLEQMQLKVEREALRARVDEEPEAFRRLVEIGRRGLTGVRG